MTLQNLQKAYAQGPECKAYFPTWGKRDWWYCELDIGHNGSHAAPTMRAREWE